MMSGPEYSEGILPEWIAQITLYLNVLRFQRRSEETITLRRYQLLRIAVAFPEGPGSVTQEGLSQWMNEQRWSLATMRSHVAAFRGFFMWRSRVSPVEDPLAGLPSVRHPEYFARPTPDDVVFNAVVSCAPREKLMIQLAGDEGMRRGEIARVHPRDVFRVPNGYNLLVHGKGNRSRVIPLWDSLAKLILSHGDDFVFPGKIDGHLSAGHVGVLIARALASKGWTAHTLRHRFATRMYEQTKDLHLVQLFLGHARPETTQVYVKVYSDHLRNGLVQLGRTTEPDPPPL